MKCIALPLAFALAAATLPTFAAAAANGQSDDADAGNQTMLDFAKCVVKRDGAMATDLLDLEPGSRAERKLGLRISKVHDRCLNADKMLYRPILLRGAVAQALYQTRGFQSPTTPKQGTFEVPRFKVEDDTINPGQRQQTRALYAFASCVASSSPVEANKLMNSEFGSADERQWVSALAPRFAPCLPTGSKVTVNKTVLRALLAEALYRWATTLLASPEAR